MKQLSVITNVVPLLARVDEIAEDQIDRVKASISEDLMASDLKLFPLGLQAPTNQLYTVCSSPSKDLENMDASLLMQSDYIQPLQASELSTMIEQLFIPDTIRRLKFFAAKKIIQNRRIQQASTIGTSSSRTGPPPSYTRSNTTPSPSDFFKTSSQVLISRTPGILTYNQSAMADHTLREERLARIHLANWASNLQRSLTNERARYEAIAKSERAEWLKARLGECLSVQDIKSTGDDTSLDMTLIPNPIPKPLRDQKQQITNIRGACSLSRGALYDAADPLGLLRWRDELGAHGMLLLKIMGGASIFGAIGTFLYFTIKNWTEASNLHQGQYSFIGEWFGCF